MLGLSSPHSFSAVRAPCTRRPTTSGRGERPLSTSLPSSPPGDHPMTDTVAPSGSIEAEVAPLVRALQEAWNTADSAGFAAPFADDADFVNVYGMHARGRDAIRGGHEGIFRSVYAGSQVEYRVAAARRLR